MNTINNNAYTAGFGSLFQPRSSFGNHGVHTNFRGMLSEQKENSVSSTFADNVVSHISLPSHHEPSAQEKTEESPDKKGLASSLARTVDFVAERYGKKTATAVMGMMYQRTGEEGVTEEKLGDSLLSAIKLIDRNFGMQEGDAFMDFLNGDLNNELNEFFDNGMEERFFAVPTEGTGSYGTTQKNGLGMALEAITEQFGESTADAITSILDQVLQEKEAGGKMKTAIQKADTLLAAQGNTQGTVTFSGLLAQKNAEMVPPKTGSLITITV